VPKEMLATEDMDTGETKCGVAPNIAHETVSKRQVESRLDTVQPSRDQLTA
jgi:hypothetical protein